jgi:hypothetical protein
VTGVPLIRDRRAPSDDETDHDDRGDVDFAYISIVLHHVVRAALQ